ncbi:MAG: MFS transporter [Chloroflexota bacterium]|nr:MFS transporter [Chloroflexota bacterium]MDE2942474.1 MFS transporter [Chloroflexota bacterium]MDE3267846.1 MFS transporter [Chloroflexota bacterium]
MQPPIRDERTTPSAGDGNGSTQEAMDTSRAREALAAASVRTPSAPEAPAAADAGNGHDGSAPPSAYSQGGMGGYRGGPVSFRNLRTFTSFKYPAFRLFYGAVIGQMAAMNMQMVARALLVYELTGSGFALSIMALGNAAPMLFFSLFGGVIADRVEKKYVLLAGQAASAVVSLVVAITLMTGLMSEERSGSWLLLVVAALVQGTIMGLMMPSRQAMIADIVGQEELMNAVALNTFGMNAMRLLAPVPVGFIIYFMGYDAVYFVMTAMYIMAVLFIWLMPKVGVGSLRGRGAMRDVVDGLRYVKGERTILMVLAVIFVVTLLSMPYMMLLPALTEDVLGIDERGYGFLLMVSGIGAMLGSIVLASLPNKKRGLMLILGSLVLGVALVGMFFSASWLPGYAVPLAFGFIFFVGIGQTARMTLGNTLLQYYVQDEYRGRVMSLMMMEFGLTSFGVVFAGIMTDVIGVQWAVGGMAILLIVFSVYATLFMPRITKLD